MSIDDSALLALVRAIVEGDLDSSRRQLAETPGLARLAAVQGATRLGPNTYFIEEIRHYLVAGDTALHMAAAAYQVPIVRELIALGADVKARNRHGDEPLHYAVDGGPGSSRWNPRDQADTIVCLIESGADPNAPDKRGVTPLHRAARNRCAAAVKALLEGGADPERVTRRSSTPMQMATRSAGRGGSGTPEAKAQQTEIVGLLERHGSN